MKLGKEVRHCVGVPANNFPDEDATESKCPHNIANPTITAQDKREFLILISKRK
jgi:hypothetical protein